MQAITCGGCGVVFGMPEKLYSNLKETGAGFTCPNGCRRHFIVEPTAEQIEIDRLKQQRSELYARISSEIETGYAAMRELRRCPLCGEPTSRARSFRTISDRLASHLRDEHGARNRLRALPAAGKTSEAR